MRKFIITAALAATAFTPMIGTFANAATVACEDMKVQVEDGLKTKQPAEADKAKFDELVAKGDERCTAEDDRRSDAFYTEALTLLGPAMTSGAATTAAVAPTAAKLGDLSSYKVIVDDTLKLVASGDIPGAQTRITDLETAWDNSQATLKPTDGIGWRAVDVELDAVLSELRVATPNATNCTIALTALDASLAASK